MPGDVLEYHMTRKAQRKTMWWYRGEAKVAGELVGRSRSSAPCWSRIKSGAGDRPDGESRSDGAVIGAGVKIGPYCVIGPNVTIGDGCKLVATCAFAGHTTIGARTVDRAVRLARHAAAIGALSGRATPR